MSADPLITVGITCYNAAATIGRAIDSALAQDWPNVEILVVDDCSTDNSCEIVESYTGVTLIRHKTNTGPGGARQTLLNAARGEFLAFFDDDDVSHPERLRTQYERIVGYEQQTGADLVACYASGTRIYPNGYALPQPAIGHKPVVPFGPAVADRILFYGKPQPGWCYGGTPSCSLMARVATFKTVGGFDPDFRRVEDLDFAVRLALAGGHFIGTPDVLFTQYATTGNGKSHGKNLEAELQLAQKHSDYLRRQGRLFYATSWPRLRHYHFRRQYMKFTITLLALLLRHPAQTATHLLRTGPARLKHEKNISGGDSA